MNELITSAAPIERLFTHVVGPFRELSLGGSKFFVTLVEDYSGFSMVKFLKSKAETFSQIKIMISNTENVYNKKLYRQVIFDRARVKWFRSDGGKKFTAELFLQWLGDKESKHEITVPYSPESNGKAEWLNYALLDMARAQLHNVHALWRGKLWADAVNSANYTRNRPFTKSSASLGTPFEILDGVKPSFQNIKRFGSKTYVHIPKPNPQNKVSGSSEVLISVGHESQSIYSVYIPEMEKVVLSKNVLLDDLNALAPRNSESASLIEFTIPSLEEDEEAETVNNIESSRKNSIPSMSGQSSSKTSGTEVDTLTYNPNLRRIERKNAGSDPERKGYA